VAKAQKLRKTWHPRCWQAWTDAGKITWLRSVIVSYGTSFRKRRDLYRAELAALEGRQVKTIKARPRGRKEER
jgi:hypothetical protein